MATPSRMLLKSTWTALKLFNKSTPILTCASGGLAFPSATSRYIDQLAVSKPIIGQQQQLSVVLRKEMLVARGRPTKVVDSEEDDNEDDEIEDGDYDDDEDDEIEDELEDAVDDEEDDMWKKVRTRSDRDAW